MKWRIGILVIAGLWGFNPNFQGTTLSVQANSYEALSLPLVSAKHATMSLGKLGRTLKPAVPLAGLFVTYSEAQGRIHALISELNQLLREGTFSGALTPTGLHDWLALKLRAQPLVILDTNVGLGPELNALVDHLERLNPSGLTPYARELNTDTRSAIIRTIMKDIIMDHHDVGLFYDSEQPETNTTMHLLTLIERELSTHGDQAGPILARTFQSVSTDNLGDVALSLWILRHLPRVLADKTLRHDLASIAWIEDFGIFGTLLRDVLAKPNSSMEFLMNTDYAILRLYDKTLQKFNVIGSDRFTFALSPEQQHALIEEIIAGIDRILDEHGGAARTEGARAFHQDIADAKPFWQVAEERSRGAFTAAGLDINGPLSGEIVWYNATHEKAPGGVFANWVAAAQLLPERIQQLSVSALPNGRFGLILAVRNGMNIQFLAQHGTTLAGVGEALNNANEKKMRKLPLLYPQPTATDLRPVVGRTAIQFSFNPGLILTFEEIAQTMDAYARSLIERTPGITLPSREITLIAA
jgi:hypothetical protein